MANLLNEEVYKKEVSGVWRVTIILSVITIIEVALAMFYIYNIAGMEEWLPRIVLNVTLIVLSLAKAFYIVGEFMHLKHEDRILIISMGIPLIFLVWAIIAFMHEADAWYHMKGF